METIASVVPSSSLVKGNEEEKNTVYLAIADCDYQLTQIEKHLYQYKKAYAYIYSCYHYRKLVLGANNPLTKLASDMTLLHNSVQGERVLCSTELKERATELGQNVQVISLTHSLSYSLTYSLTAGHGSECSIPESRDKQHLRAG